MRQDVMSTCGTTAVRSGRISGRTSSTGMAIARGLAIGGGLKRELGWRGWLALMLIIVIVLVLILVLVLVFDLELEG